jgi:hypothetical protein
MASTRGSLIKRSPEGDSLLSHDATANHLVIAQTPSLDYPVCSVRSAALLSDARLVSPRATDRRISTYPTTALAHRLGPVADSTAQRTKEILECGGGLRRHDSLAAVSRVHRH